MALGSSSPFPYSQKPGRRRVWDISVGKEIPAFGWERRVKSMEAPSATRAVTDCFAAEGYPPPGCTGFGVWVPVSLHTVEDFKDPSNPIVDTDYRFGCMLKVEHRFGRPRARIDDVRLLKLRMYFGHESTHLGDKFIMAAERNREQTNFERINVSYQYWEYGISYERARRTHTVKLRHGGTVLDPLTASWQNGFYDFNPLETFQRPVTPSVRKFEPSFGFEYLKDNIASRVPSYKPFISADVRWKTVYDYTKPRVNQPDDGQWSWNVLTGVRRARGLGDASMPSLYVRLYYGADPWGQLRSQKNYLLLGVGLHLVM
jgi:hypothetical protein